MLCQIEIEVEYKLLGVLFCCNFNLSIININCKKHNVNVLFLNHAINFLLWLQV